jgi:hypothetical protein
MRARVVAASSVSRFLGFSVSRFLGFSVPRSVQTRTGLKRSTLTVYVFVSRDAKFMENELDDGQRDITCLSEAPIGSSDE